jgi:hypothetical protein
MIIGEAAVYDVFLQLEWYLESSGWRRVHGLKVLDGCG